MLVKSMYTVIEHTDEGIVIYNTKNGVQAVIADGEHELADDIAIIEQNKICDDVKDETLKRVFCVDSEVSELDAVMADYYRQMFDPTSLSFIIMPNNICNFGCIYCYQEHDERRMTEQTIENFIAAVKDHYHRVGLKHFYAEWFGGEPFMTYDILEYVTRELSEFFEENGVEYHFGATTNGSLFTDDRIDFLMNHKFDFFQITVDGARSSHNETRPFLNGSGTWDIICENLKKLHKRPEKFRVSVRVNYNNRTMREIDSLFEFIRDNLDDRFGVFFHTIGKWGGKSDDMLETIDSAIEPYTTLALMEQALEYGISPKMNYDFFNPFGRVCYAGCPYHFTLGSDGKLRKCNEEDEEKDCFNIVGTVENGKIEFDIGKWSKFVLPGGSAVLRDKCQKCVFLPICYAQRCPRNCVTDKEPACGEDFPLMTELILNKYKRKKKLEQSEVR